MAHRRPGGADTRSATVPTGGSVAVAFADMSATKRIAILTGGGDVPGLNAVIKSVVYRATTAGYEVLGLRRGWEGLTHVRPQRHPRPGLPATAGPDEHPHDRSDRRHHPAHVADEPAPDARPPACRAG